MKHKSDPMTGRATTPLPRAKPTSHHRPAGFVHNPDESDYHKRANEKGYVAGRRIA